MDCQKYKDGVSLRPILDMCNSPYHVLVKWLAKLLEPVRVSLAKHYVQDTFTLVEKIRDINLVDRTMLSLNVSSSFTNVPISETIEYLCSYLRTNNVELGLPLDDLKQLLYFCTYNVQFKFNEEIYRQKDGVAMGSPLGTFFRGFIHGEV
ncbi:unnamed protein product [Echinostoma caproni]|uniref:Reverse transcriptase domain-containing protein n=1 Tax=Echinostoma caproni TaxID=27848 RepID=A0A183A905_9TREM|nr:unnamed protein product [Echinostoma caproni]